MVDQRLLEEKTRLLAEYIADLEEQQHISLAQLKDNKLLRRYIERTLHLAVEACLGIGSHVIASRPKPGGRRVGFEIVTLGGARAVLAHVGSPSRRRVGKYGVGVENLSLAADERQGLHRPHPDTRRCLLGFQGRRFASAISGNGAMITPQWKCGGTPRDRVRKALICGTF